MHGSRDYYYLIKHIVHSLRNNAEADSEFVQSLITTARTGIARNFGGSHPTSETSFNTFLAMFKA